jgi:hypothetical protein
LSPQMSGDKRNHVSEILVILWPKWKRDHHAWKTKRRYFFFCSKRDKTSKPMGLCSAAAAEKRRRLPRPTNRSRSFFLDPGTKQQADQPTVHEGQLRVRLCLLQAIPQGTTADLPCCFLKSQPGMNRVPLFLSHDITAVRVQKRRCIATRARNTTLVSVVTVTLI